MTYPFTPQWLDAMPDPLAAQYRKLEETLLEEICSRLKLAGQLNEVTVQAIRALRSHGIDLRAIEQAVADTAGISERDLDALLTDVVLRNQQYYTQLLTLADVTQPEQLVDAAAVEAIRAQTMSTFRNLTASMGFLVNAGRTVLPPSQAYQWALDQAVLQMQTGAVSYDRAIQSAVKQLASSGLKVVNYASGHADQIDVAARRAVMTGVSQICAQYTEQSAAYLDTPYFEISAHVGARDKPGPSPWSSHKAWQGRVYSTRSGDIYPNIYETCGLGYVDGLEGANCRHRRFPWIEGVSERTYTDAQLAHIDDGKGGTFDGVTYTAYEATQMQRKLERTIRKVRREKKAYQAAGLTDDATASGIRLRRLNDKYTGFCQAADLPTQKERLKVLYVDENTLNAKAKSGIIKTGEKHVQRLISGARNPWGKAASKHANLYYAFIRSIDTDAAHIAANTGFSEDVIREIKRYLFLDSHELWDGVRQFDPDYMIAQSWQRLMEGKHILPHDLLLLQHEALERSLVQAGRTQDEAHIIASRKFNYSKEATAYYAALKKYRKE